MEFPTQPKPGALLKLSNGRWRWEGTAAEYIAQFCKLNHLKHETTEDRNHEHRKADR